MKSKLVVAEIPYLNSAPFFWNKNLHIPGCDVSWRRANPKELGALAREGEIDAGPVSLLNNNELSAFEPMPFGITARNEAQSVILFSRRPFQELNQKQIGMTQQSATSTELLKLLMKEVYHVSPVFSPGLSTDDSARLLIGNQALFALLDSGTTQEFPYRLDLGLSWKKWKGHSFVFARWMMRKELSDMIKSRLDEWLSENIRGFEENPQRALEAFENGQGWKIENGLKYLLGFDYRISENDYLGSLTTLSQFSSQRATPIS